jgi:hypothetical protein
LCWVLIELGFFVCFIRSWFNRRFHHKVPYLFWMELINVTQVGVGDPVDTGSHVCI